MQNSIYEYHQGEGTGYPLFLFQSDYGYEFGVRMEQFPIDFPDVSIIRTISVFCEPQKPPPLDIRVGITVCHIIETYLLDNADEVMTYVCDNLDGKGHVRQDKFKRWYNCYGNGQLLALPHIISTPNDEIHTCLIFHPSVYDENRIMASYKDEIDSMENHKS